VYNINIEMNPIFKKSIKYFFILILLVGSFIVYASETDGTISDTYFGALLCTNSDCTTTTRINFKPTLGNAVHITDTAVTGDVWSETMGWIRFNPGGGYGGVTNNTSGVLGGYAWGDGAGWINFKPTQGGVTINSTGQFAGFAWSENYGWIKFDCAVTNACVKTDWRPLSARTVTPPTPPVTPPSGGDGSGYVAPVRPVVPPVVPPIESPIIPPATPPIIEPVVTPPTEPMVEPGAPPEVGPTTSPEDGPSGPTNLQGESSSSSSSPLSSFFPAVTQVMVESVVQITKESFNKTVDIAKKATEEIIKIMETREGDIASKVITTTGAIAGAGASIATVLFINPLSFGELFLIPLRLWSLLLAALGLKKKNKPWGTVYDSVTKQPLDPAYVILEDLNGKEIATSITDLDGRYGFLIPAGQYRIVAKKTNYTFPSNKLLGKNNDELYQELYFNEIINVIEGGVIAKNIPMDPINFDWNEFAKKQEGLMKFFSLRDIWVNHISDILFIFGIVVALIAVIVSPVLYNIAIVVVYVILFILKKTILRPKAFGYVKQKTTGKPLSFAIIRIFFAGSENEVIHKITDKNGKYYCLIPNGIYYAKIENKNPDGSYSLVYKSEPIEVTEGYLKENFNV
jgi:hypothetical protein